MRLPSRATALVLYSAIVTTISAALVLRNFYTFDGIPISFGRALVWQAAVFGSWAMLVPAIAIVGRRARPSGPGLIRASVGFYAAALSVPLHSAFSSWVAWLARPRAPGAERPAFESVFPSLLIDRMPVDLLVYCAIVGALLATQYAGEIRRRERAAALLEVELVRAQLHALRAQLQPHFLFNTLQGIAGLISRQPEVAKRMTILLGDLLRGVLQRSGQPEVALSDEMTLLETYLEIETLRFGDRLRVQYDIDPAALTCLVPDLLLQPIAENAVRHGLTPMPAGGMLHVRGRRDGSRLRLTVTDDGAGLPSDWSDGTADGLGLAITRERLAHHYGGDARLTVAPSPGGRGTQVAIDLPAREAR